MHKAIKNGQIFEAAGPLQKLMAVKLPVKTGYQLSKAVIKFNERLKAIEEVRLNLVDRYGTEEEGIKGKIVKDDNPDFDKFVKEVEELFDIEEDMILQKIRLPNDLEIEVDVLMPLVDIGLIEEPC